MNLHFRVGRQTETSVHGDSQDAFTRSERAAAPPDYYTPSIPPNMLMRISFVFSHRHFAIWSRKAAKTKWPPFRVTLRRVLLYLVFGVRFRAFAVGVKCRGVCACITERASPE